MQIFTQKTGSNRGFFYDGELIHHEQSFQDIKIIDTPAFSRCLLLDDAMMLSTKQEHEYHELLVHLACLQLEQLQYALVIGGGDCFTANLLAQYPFKQIDVVEFDPAVVSVCQEYFAEQLTHINTERIRYFYEDGNTFTSQLKYDFIAMDLTDPVEGGPAFELFAKESFSRMKTMMSEDSILTVQAACPYTDPKTFKTILESMQSQFQYVIGHGKYIEMYGCHQFFISGSDSIDVRGVDGRTIRKNLSYVHPQLYTLNYHVHLLNEFDLVVNPMLQKA